MDFSVLIVVRNHFIPNSKFQFFPRASRTKMVKRKYTYGSVQSAAKKRKRYNRKTSVIPARYMGRYRTSSGSTRAGELKAVDGLLSADNLASTAVIVGTNGLVDQTAIAQGTGDDQRIGRKITVKSMECNLGVKSDSSRAFANLRLVLDTQTNGAHPSYLDIMSSNIPQQAFPNLDNRERFKTLWKFQGALPFMNGSSSECSWNIFKKMNLPVHFSGSTGAIADIRDNNVYLIADSDASIDISLGFRLRYED